MAKGVKTGGRTAGTPNKATADIKAIAQQYGEEAIEGLIQIARNSKVEALRLKAWGELLDRGYGRSGQAVDVTGKCEEITTVRRVIVDPANADSAVDVSKMAHEQIIALVAALGDETDENERN